MPDSGGPDKVGNQLRASVAICTHNRAGLLESVISSVLDQQLGDGATLEVLVVDNASTDDTEAKTMHLAAKDERVRYVLEPKLGLSHARNRALREARADLVAFIDDDAIAQPGWLESVIGAAEGSVGVAGRIELALQAPRPNWLRPGSDLEAMLSALDLGGMPTQLNPDQSPYGANMAVDRGLALEIGGFDSRLGRSGSKLLSMEELDFVDRLRRHGKISYHPRAVVRHLVPPERLRVMFFVRRSYWQGRSEVIAGRTGTVRAVRGAGGSLIRLLRTQRRDKRERAVLLLCNVAYMLGVFVEMGSGRLASHSTTNNGS